MGIVFQIVSVLFSSLALIYRIWLDLPKLLVSER